MRQFLDKVTVTGADDAFNIDDMLEISARHPFVEWGILLSANSAGRPRFPSGDWVEKLAEAKLHNPGLKLSAHLCGRWVREFCEGRLDSMLGTPAEPTRLQPLISAFTRIQLNFHAIAHKANVPAMVKAMKQFEGFQFILQLDGHNDHILDQVKAEGVDAVGLFDLSGGAGILPETWPIREFYAGYAGGLAPENVAAQLEVIEKCAHTGAWIDAETKLRTTDDSRMVPALVDAYLKAARPWVMGL